MSVSLLFVAAVLASEAAVGQPASVPSSSNTPDARQFRSAIPRQVSVDGCVATGAEVGRKADFVERTGLDQHFVLIGATVKKGTGPQVGPPASAPTATASMFKITGLTDEQLTIHIGRRVRIEGSLGNLERAFDAASSPQDALVELKVATIRQMPGACAVPKS